MNYRHSYHAGSFADVFKHIILVILLNSLRRKDNAFCYLDTHAGGGCYDLFASLAQKTAEYKSGILPLWQERASAPTKNIQDYLTAIAAFNKDETLRYYPGSPMLAYHFIRPQDHMILSELHPEEYSALKQSTQDNRVAVHHMDGYQALKAFLPPKERRGLVLIDPPYERKDEFEQIPQALAMALKRWATGIYAIWYPVKDLAAVNNFKQALKKLQLEKILVLELNVLPADSPIGIKGTGMIVINPPWQFAEEMQATLPWLQQILSSKPWGSYQIEDLSVK